MALNKDGMNLKAIDSLPNKGRASVDHSKSAAKKKELAKKVSGSKQKTPRDMEISEAIKRGKEMGNKTRSNHLNGIY